MKERLFQWVLLAGLLASSGQDLLAQGRDLELLSKPPYPIEVQGRVDRLTPSDDNPNVMETEEGIFFSHYRRRTHVGSHQNSAQSLEHRHSDTRLRISNRWESLDFVWKI